MAQNNTKSLKGGAAGKSGSGGRKNAGITKKGKRAVAPKDLAGIRKTQVQKKLSSSINKNIERQMVQAAKSGKLTIMKGVGQDENATDAKGKDKAKGKPKK